jgi:hypothetical protein
MDLGVSSEGDSIDDVILPPWAKVSFQLNIFIE